MASRWWVLSFSSLWDVLDIHLPWICFSLDSSPEMQLCYSIAVCMQGIASSGKYCIAPLFSQAAGQCNHLLGFGQNELGVAGITAQTPTTGLQDVKLRREDRQQYIGRHVLCSACQGFGCPAEQRRRNFGDGGRRSRGCQLGQWWTVSKKEERKASLQGKSRSTNSRIKAMMSLIFISEVKFAVCWASTPPPFMEL